VQAATSNLEHDARARPVLRAGPVAVAAAALAVVVGLTGDICRGAERRRPINDVAGVHAVFAERSYSPGTRAELRIWNPTDLTVQIFRAGRRSLRDDTLRGDPVGAPIRHRRPARQLSVRVGYWPSGLYFARLRAADGRMGFAPLIVRPHRLGQSRVAVVLPTHTWQAYNFRDVNGDAVGDTWYASSAIHTVRLDRPFLDRGVPPHFRGYDAAFASWLLRTKHTPDVLADEDLDRVPSGEVLARRYDLIIFPGHEEYVTAHMYDVIERYRDLGGNLAFLSANNFFYRVEHRGSTLHGRVRWRDIGRPESALIGSQYVDWFREVFPNRPYRVVGAAHAPWLLVGTGLRNGSLFGNFGIEIDARTSVSPKGTRVLARIPNIFGRGKSAEMTYYETRAGAKVFAAGVLNFAGAAWYPPVSRMIENVWARLARP
jgi:hypothetical protein